jgi:hypothetical protein
MSDLNHFSIPLHDLMNPNPNMFVLPSNPGVGPRIRNMQNYDLILFLQNSEIRGNTA